MAADQPSRVERRLAAILAADVAGYSRLMGLDEAGTARILREHRVVTDALTAKHGGRIVKTTGDGVLLEFPSVVDAVECAVAVQAVMAERNEGIPQDRRMQYRIGINLGDILIDGDDILGDSVNVTARLEGIAEPGGICISSSAYDQVSGKVAVEFTDLGEQTLKNIARPIRAYAVVQNGHSATRQRGSPTPNSPSTPRLSIVVLPFANLGGDPEQDYFVDGVTESLTTDLSRIGGSFVIARNTAFTYKGKPFDVKKIGRELNVRYVLEGSVQRGSNRLRINVQLIDADSGAHLWAERFDKPLADLFDMQDEIVARLANQLGAHLIAAEARRAERSPHPDSMDLYFQGMASVNKGWTPDHMLQARSFFERALALDPGNVEAAVGIATVDTMSGFFFMTDERGDRFAASEAVLNKVLSSVPDHASAHLYLGFVQIHTHRISQGIAEFEQALAIDHNLAMAHGFIGQAKYFVGRGAETEAHIHEALRLSPRDTNAYVWLTIAGVAKLQLGADEEAVVLLHRAVDMNRNLPLAHFWLATALAHVSRISEAQKAALAGLALDRTFTIARFRDNPATDSPAYLAGREHIYEGLRRAGVPEG
ncbi:adenylate/guanylate cyclase domain-containing protein [Bradyrhizobium sp.]|uniref:adenylate/guanylate cyclase domain-containing protein n=1 Tax=Bradyrhizobium sp. TaxID=376 RepID=UPI002626F0A0|nr:adenylate/guanylate cyclase domain-containing protein [Bradyrhizobium sp.]